ncbi:glycosyltransferase [Oenococcus oeni]|uniref:glycosyltransferase n=1 Tax=Oenococcus oeni TaxID=1247 RepID=UPI00050E72B5|nr:glycosyltransferase [Oenococcus oeni]KGH82100.1 glycosyl transferase family 1 [Oenococcus oeni S14]
MNFFINSNMQKNKSGIEHAELKRAALFRDHHESFKIVLRDWSQTLHKDIKDSGLSDAEVINMFDYFQGTEKVTEKNIQAKDIDFGVAVDLYENDPKNNRVLAWQVIKKINGESQRRLLGRINYFSFAKDRISSTEMFDAFGNLYAVNYYDIRGFLSLTQWYTPDNKIGTESWQTLDRRSVLESFNKFDAKGEFKKSGWRLVDKNGSIYTFQTIEELTKHFLDSINFDYSSQERGNVFILDRTHLGDWALRDLKKPAYTVIHLHNSQAGNAEDEMHSILNNHYEYSLWNTNDYDAIISATSKQTADVAKRFKPQARLFTIPVGVIPSKHFQEQRIPMSDRFSHKIVALARIAPEKRLNDLVKAVGIAKKEIPDISLDLYGYRDSSDNFKAYQDIKKAVEDYRLADAVKVHGYTTNVSVIEKKAQIFAVTSIMEGFNLSMMEALSEGDVGLTYDVNYGPNELVVDGENGYIVPNGDYHALAEKIIFLFKRPDELQKKSERAYELSKRYSETKVWQDWRELLGDAQDKWPEKISHYKSPLLFGLAENGGKL